MHCIDLSSITKGKVAPAKEAHTAGAYPSFCSMKQLRVLLLPLDGMLVHYRVPPQQYVAGTHLYTWVDRDNVG